MVVSYALFIALGFGIGTVGTLIGAGGGFILVPLMLLLFPDLSAQSITAISMAIVAINATSGSVAYMKSKRIDYRSGILFAVATIPGSVLGVLTTQVIPRTLFNIIFGIILFVVSGYLFAFGGKRKPLPRKTVQSGHTVRRFTDGDGHEYTYSYNLRHGIILSTLVGFFSPLLGIGGGIIHVPAMTEWLLFPAHIATATSHFILAIMATVSVIVHLVEGSYSQYLITLIVPLAIGVIPGALVGARLSKKVNGIFIVRALAVCLAIVGIRILWLAFL